MLAGLRATNSGSWSGGVWAWSLSTRSAKRVSRNWGAGGVLGLVEGARGAEFDDGPVIGIERKFLEEIGSTGEIATVEKQDGLRVDGQHELLHVEVGGSLHRVRLVVGGIEGGGIEGGGGQRAKIGMADERRDFGPGLEVSAPQADLRKCGNHRAGDDAEFPLGHLVKWQPLDENAAGLEALADDLETLAAVEISRAPAVGEEEIGIDHRVALWVREE